MGFYLGAACPLYIAFQSHGDSGIVYQSSRTEDAVEVLLNILCIFDVLLQVRRRVRCSPSVHRP
eukprot:4336458-Prymnesium_polylepis.2